MEIFKNFNELFEAALEYDNFIEKPANKNIKHVLRNDLDAGFTTWLHQFKGLGNEIENEKQYNEFLTIEIFKEFLEYYYQREIDLKNEAEKEHEAKKKVWEHKTLEPQQTDNKYLVWAKSNFKGWNFEHLKEHLQTFNNTLEKIEYLINVKAIFEQRKADFKNTFPSGFGKMLLGDINFNEKCEAEIIKLKALYEIEQLKNTQQPQNTANEQPNNPLKNYRNFIWSYETFFQNCKYDFKDNNKDKILLHCEQMRNENIINVAHIAKQEIENLIFTNNNNSEKLIQSIQTDCLKLNKQAETLMNENKLNHCDIMPQYIQYFNTIQIFYNFLNFIDEKIGIDLNNTVKPKQEQGEQPEPKETPELQPVKPIFRPEIIQSFFDLHKDFFNIEQQSEFIEILKSGGNTVNRLTFLDNGNRLADSFKKLFENNFITGCQKCELQNWISDNFNYTYRNEIKIFTKDYIEKIVSRTGQYCKSPIIEIEKGLIVKTEQPRQRKQTNY